MLMLLLPRCCPRSPTLARGGVPFIIAAEVRCACSTVHPAASLTHAQLAGPEADDDTAAAAAAAQEAPSAPAVAARDEAAVRAQEPAMDSELLRALAAARARSRVGSRRSALSRDTTATAASGGSKGCARTGLCCALLYAPCP